MPEAPTLTSDQRKLAAARSLLTRRARADLKRDITQHGLPYFWMMFNHAVEAQGMRVYSLLTALPGIGQAKARKLLAEAGIPEKNTVRACGPKQRERLAELLR